MSDNYEDEYKDWEFPSDYEDHEDLRRLPIDDTLIAEIEALYGVGEAQLRSLIIEFRDLGSDDFANLRGYIFPALEDAIQFLGNVGLLSFSKISTTETGDGYYVVVPDASPGLVA